MRNHETGEFEVVVGNRQLLSGFFIVVLLFAVAFAMGYVVGQNSPRSAKVATEATTGSSTTPLAASDTRPQPATPVPQAPGANSQPDASQPAGDAPAQPTTHPAREAEAAPQPSAAAAAADPPVGSYWQVMAVPQADAEVVVRALKDKGFPSMMSQGPNNLMRVLVGQYNDTPSFGKAKTELENAGFHPIRKQ
jgi:hypothetical protein